VHTLSFETTQTTFGRVRVNISPEKTLRQQHDETRKFHNDVTRGGAAANGPTAPSVSRIRYVRRIHVDGRVVLAIAITASFANMNISSFRPSVALSRGRWEGDG